MWPRFGGAIKGLSRMACKVNTWSCKLLYYFFVSFLLILIGLDIGLLIAEKPMFSSLAEEAQGIATSLLTGAYVALVAMRYQAFSNLRSEAIQHFESLTISYSNGAGGFTVDLLKDVKDPNLKLDILTNSLNSQGHKKAATSVGNAAFKVLSGQGHPWKECEFLAWREHHMAALQSCSPSVWALFRLFSWPSRASQDEAEATMLDSIKGINREVMKILGSTLTLFAIAAMGFVLGIIYMDGFSWPDGKNWIDGFAGVGGMLAGIGTVSLFFLAVFTMNQWKHSKKYDVEKSYEISARQYDYYLSGVCCELINVGIPSGRSDNEAFEAGRDIRYANLDLAYANLTRAFDKLMDVHFEMVSHKIKRKFSVDQFKDIQLKKDQIDMMVCTVMDIRARRNKTYPSGFKLLKDFLDGYDRKALEGEGVDEGISWYENRKANMKAIFDS